MDTLKALKTRISTRNYSDKPISKEEIYTILEAGMSGPTATNARPWSFIVVEDKDTMNKMADANLQYAEPLRKATMAILVCGDLDRAFKVAPDFWVVDGSIACQNMILAAHDMGIGSCWLGVWPMQDRVENQAKLFYLPDTIIPHSIITFGYPQKESTKTKLLYEEDRVHFEKW